MFRIAPTVSGVVRTDDDRVTDRYLDGARGGLMFMA
jgi:hypothetical protein